ncbi:MAG TPA: 1-acyl-sn-glycerol-3-phosphate acyltransferase [Anaerolineae bacterium]|nr:1-acyl-sn-glycerol-3-phosphate acyltransferase [Anaerolineae bacterium]
MRRKLIHALFRFLFSLLTKMEVHGIENIPEQGAFIIVSNHLGILDPPLVFAVLDSQDLTAFIAKKHKRNPIFRWFVNGVGGIWLNRIGVDTLAFREAKKLLENGGALGIAPEGTRSPTHALIQAKTGAAYLVDKTRTPVIPLAITGTENAESKILRLQRPRITVKIGEPFILPPINKENRTRDLQQNTDEIMCRIAVLLPPAYRGVYANHPRLLALSDDDNYLS